MGVGGWYGLLYGLIRVGFLVIFVRIYGSYGVGKL